MTKTYRISNAISGLVLGCYTGSTADEALDAMARDAGYADRKDMDRRAEGGEDLRATECVGYVIESRSSGRWTTEGLGDRIVWSSRERAEEELPRLARAFGDDEGAYRVTEVSEEPHAGF